MKPQRDLFPSLLSHVLPPLRAMPPHVQWRMVQSAFVPILQSASPALLCVIAGLAAFAATEHMVFAVWALCAACGVFTCRQCAMRMALSSKDSGAPASWIALYVACAWGNAALLGAGGALAAAHGAVASAIMAGPLGFAAAHAATKAVFSRAAQGEAVLLLGPLAITALASGSSPLMALGGVAVLQVGWALTEADNAAAGAAAIAAAAGAPQDFLAAPVDQKTPETSFQEKFGRDPATGFPNLPRFLHIMAQESLRAVQSAAPLSLLLIQCDAPVPMLARGRSQSLQPVPAARAHRMQSVLWRPGDTLASFGDNRFAILLPFTDAMGCATVAAKLRTAMAEFSAETDDADHTAQTTLSIGMATYVGYGPIPLQLMEFAEQALIDARRLGGDQACRYDSVIETLRPAAYRPAVAVESSSVASIQGASLKV